MHEMALSEGVMQIVEANARSQGFRRVKAVWLEIEIDGETRFTFDAVSRGTLADGAALEILDSPGQAWCMPCGCTVHVSQRFDACPNCGSFQLQVTGGDELKVKELEVE